jgi:Transcriptional repressor NrdR-like, N-terminal domain
MRAGETGLRCPQCQRRAGNTVVDSRATHDGSWVRRRRQCLACQARFTTHETFVTRPEPDPHGPEVWTDRHARAKAIAAELREMARCLEVW